MKTQRLLWALACALFVASAARSAEPVPPATTNWLGAGEVKAKIAGAGSIPPGPIEVSVAFGPNTGLDANEFAVEIDDGMESFTFPGTYTLDAKGQPVLALDLPATSAGLLAVIVHVCDDVLMLDPALCAELGMLDVIFDPSKLKLKLKTNAGKNDDPTVTVNGKMPFALSNGVEELKVTLSFKTTPRAELVK
jgi:hypothetical protein